MGLSGWIVAKCRVCSTEIEWYINDMPFPDSIVLGTCKKCSEKMDAVKEKDEGEIK